MCSTFYRFPDGLACLWEAVAGRAAPRWPRRSHHDAAIGLTWSLKDNLPARRSAYYGKLLRGRPVLVALDLFPAFYALVRGRQRARDWRAEYAAGRLSAATRRIVEDLEREGPQWTRSLRANTFMLAPERTREFERAMAEAQGGLWIVKTAERYEPTFSYGWDLLERWLPDAVAAGRRLGRTQALARIVERVAAGAVWTSPARLARLLGVSGAELAPVVAGLVRSGVLVESAIADLPGRWLVHRAGLG